MVAIIALASLKKCKVSVLSRARVKDFLNGDKPVGRQNKTSRTSKSSPPWRYILTQLNTLFITLPYYNNFYGTQKCEKYVGKLTQCTYKFLSYELTEDILDGAIKSIDTEIKPVIPEPVVKKTFFEKAYETVKTFLTDWGINIGLFLFFGIVTAVIGEKIYRKIKHGI